LAVNQLLACLSDKTNNEQTETLSASVDTQEDELTVAVVIATVTEVTDVDEAGESRDDNGAERSDLSLSTLPANVFSSCSSNTTSSINTHAAHCYM